MANFVLNTKRGIPLKEKKRAKMSKLICDFCGASDTKKQIL